MHRVRVSTQFQILHMGGGRLLILNGMAAAGLDGAGVIMCSWVGKMKSDTRHNLT